jgi:hypothetical protein
MDVYSTELGIRLSFGKTSDFREGFPPPRRYATDHQCLLTRHHSPERRPHCPVTPCNCHLTLNTNTIQSSRHPSRHPSRHHSRHPSSTPAVTRLLWISCNFRFPAASSRTSQKNARTLLTLFPPLALQNVPNQTTLP